MIGRRLTEPARAWMAREEKSHLAAVGAIFVLAVVLRLDYTDVPIRYDEAFTFTTYASGPIADLLSKYDFPNNQILHSALVHYAWRVFGNEPWVLRLPALLAGIALVPAVYAAARAFYDKHAALWAMGLAAASAPLVAYSAKSRGYTITILCLVLALALAPRPAAGAPAWLWGPLRPGGQHVE